jgi:hypothetical protein
MVYGGAAMLEQSNYSKYINFFERIFWFYGQKVLKSLFLDKTEKRELRKIMQRRESKSENTRHTLKKKHRQRRSPHM